MKRTKQKRIGYETEKDYLSIIETEKDYLSIIETEKDYLSMNLNCRAVEFLGESKRGVIIGTEKDDP